MFVEKVRGYSKNKQTFTERDMVEIMDSCIKEGILPDFLSKHGREAVGMMFRELIQEEAMEMSRQDGYVLGVEKGIEEGRTEGLEQGSFKQSVYGIMLFSPRDNCTSAAKRVGFSDDKLDKIECGTCGCCIYEDGLWSWKF